MSVAVPGAHMLNRLTAGRTDRVRLLIGGLLALPLLYAAHLGLGWPRLAVGSAYAGLLTSALMSSLLLVIAALVPPRPAPAWSGARPRDDPALALGVLLLGEPLLLFMILLWSAHDASALSIAIILPAQAPGAAGMGMITVQLLVLAALAPVAEEMVFRDRLLPWLAIAGTRLGAGRAAPALAMFGSTAVFAWAHADPVRALVAAPLGLLLAGIRMRSPDLHGCILAHAVHNSLLVLAGSALIAQPTLPPLLALVGGILLLLHRFHRHGPATARRLAWTLGAAALISLLALGLAPGVRRWHDRLWIAAIDHQVRACGGSDQALLGRLEHLRHSGWLDAEQRSALYTALCQGPWPEAPLRPTDQVGAQLARRTCLLADLDAGRFAAAVGSDQAYDRLLDLATIDPPPPMITAGALRLGLRYPDAFADVAGLSPAILRGWLPLPQAGPTCVALVAASRGRARRQLLTALEISQPGQVAAIIVQVPADRLGALDRRHLALYYPHADQLLLTLRRDDPARYRALTGMVAP